MNQPQKQFRQRGLPHAFQTALLCLVLFGGTVWTFFPALRNGFVDYDDADYVTQNSHVRGGLTWENAKWAFTDTEAAGLWHPLTWLSHMLDCQMFGLSPWGHHLTSILIHALNVLLVFVIFKELTGAMWRSWLLAALFGLHPLRVESVAWVAERKDVLSALFWLLTMWAYARAVSSDKWQVSRNDSFLSRITCHWSLYYFLALLFFVCGLMSKPMLVTLPFVLLLLDYWPLERFTIHNSRFTMSRLALEKVPFFLAAIAVIVVTFLAQSAAKATSVGVPLSARLENALVSYGRYLGKIFRPVDLAFFYPHPAYWPAWLAIAPAILLLGISLFVVAFRRGHPYLPVGWFWFLGTLVPAIGLVQVGEQAMADRFTYLPSLGVLVVIIWGVHELTQRWRHSSVAFGVSTVAGMIPCIVLCRQQIAYWKDDEALCRHALAVTENNHVAHFCLGVAYEKQHRPDEAIGEYQAALAANPNYSVAHNNLGFALCSEGRFDEALSQFQTALDLNTEPAKAHFGMGVVFGREGYVADAVTQFQEAVKLQPDWPDAHYNLGIALDHDGKLESAVHELQQAVAMEPDSAEFRFNLGNVLARLNRRPEAINQFQKSLELEPSSVNCHVNLGNALAQSGRLDDAIGQFRIALTLNPEIAEIHNNLGLALEMRGVTNEAAAEFQHALGLKPDYPDAQKNLESLAKNKIASSPPAN